MILEQLLEKKDIEIYLKYRIAIINSYLKNIKDFPEKEREYIKERFLGRRTELEMLKDVIVQGKLKMRNKEYYENVGKLK